MPRASSVIAAGQRHGRPVIDTVILDYAQRSAPKARVSGVKGGAIEIELHAPRRLAPTICSNSTTDAGGSGGGGGAAHRGAGSRCRRPGAARLASRRPPCARADAAQPHPRLRNEATEALLKPLGAKVALIEAPFEPEGGAYASGHGSTVTTITRTIIDHGDARSHDHTHHDDH